MSSLRLPATLLLVSAASAFFPPTSWVSSRTGSWAGGVGSPWPSAPRSRTHASASAWGGRQDPQQQQQHHGGGISANVNLVVVPGARTGDSRRLGGSSSGSSSSRNRNRRNRDRGSATTLGMMAEAGAGYSEQQGGGGAAGRSAVTDYVPEYGMPSELGIELVRLDMPEVPVDRAQSFVRSWAKRRIGAAAEQDPGWQGALRPVKGGPRYGVPPTDMPVSAERSDLGATLSFDGSPTDVVKIEVYYLRRGGSCVMVTRGVDGLAKLGGMGPQIASLVRHSEDVIKERLQADLTSFADEYHDRVLKGLALPAESYDEADEKEGEGEGEGEKPRERQQEATILADGTIDVTPVDPQPPAAKKPKKKKKVAPWMDGSAPPPVDRMEDAPIAMELPDRAPAAGGANEVPELTTFFDDVDKPKLEAEAFELFKTMERGEKGEERVAGAEGKGGAGAFFSEMRADNGTSEAELVTLFEAGRNASRRGGVDQGSIPISSDLHRLEVMLGGDTGLRGGIDIFAGPPQPIGGRVGGAASSSSPSSGGVGEAEERSEAPDKESERGTYTMFDEYGDPVLELTAEEMDSLDEDELVEAMASIDVLIGELLSSPKDAWNSVTASYSDLYLNRCYILAMRARIPKSSRKERDAMIAANQAAVNTVQQLAKMHQRLEMQQLEKIRDICEAALEDMDSLPDKIRYMKPLLDDKFVAYMGYAIQTEREEIEKRGFDADREPSRWLQVLGVIQKGVMAELQKSVHKDVEAISHVLRLTEPHERLALLNITISTLPSMYVRGFKRTATNIVDYYEAMGDDCADPDLRSMVLEIGENLKVLMSEERMAVLTKEIDDWAAKKAEEDSMESKLRRVREYEAEDVELRRATASGLWNKKMDRDDPYMATEEKAEIRKLTDALKGQNLLRTEKIQNALAAKGITQGGGGGGGGVNTFDNEDSRTTGFGGFGGLDQDMSGLSLSGDGDFYDDDDDDDDGGDLDMDDGGYTDDDDLRRKLNRLAGPGGAMEAESREAPHLFGPGGPLESPEMARAVGGPAASGAAGGGLPGAARLSELEKEVAADVAGMSDLFSDAKAYSGDSMPHPASVREEEDREGGERDGEAGDDWGAFDEDDWRGKEVKSQHRHR